MPDDPLVQVTVWLVVVTAVLALVTFGLVVIGVFQYFETRRTSAEVTAQREAIEKMAIATAENADASRRTVEELRAQRAAADPLRLEVSAETTPDGTRFEVQNRQGAHGERRAMVLTRWEIRTVLYRAGHGDAIAQSDADDAIAPGGSHYLQVVALPDSGDVAVILEGHPLNGLKQRMEYRFRRADGEWVAVEDFHYQTPFVSWA